MQIFFTFLFIATKDITLSMFFMEVLQGKEYGSVCVCARALALESVMLVGVLKSHALVMVKHHAIFRYLYLPLPLPNKTELAVFTESNG